MHSGTLRSFGRAPPPPPLLLLLLLPLAWPWGGHQGPVSLAAVGGAGGGGRGGVTPELKTTVCNSHGCWDKYFDAEHQLPYYYHQLPYAVHAEKRGPPWLVPEVEQITEAFPLPQCIRLVPQHHLLFLLLTATLFARFPSSYLAAHLF